MSKRTIESFFTKPGASAAAASAKAKKPKKDDDRLAELTADPPLDSAQTNAQGASSSSGVQDIVSGTQSSLSHDNVACLRCWSVAVVSPPVFEGFRNSLRLEWQDEQRQRAELNKSIALAKVAMRK
eukprot:4619279-Pyramimonas_sp.AAC.2